jgi:hypothetical protein
MIDKETAEKLKQYKERIHNLEIAVKHYELEAASLNILAQHALADIKATEDTDAHKGAAIAISEKIISITGMYT